MLAILGYLFHLVLRDSKAVLNDYESLYGFMRRNTFSAAVIFELQIMLKKVIGIFEKSKSVRDKEASEIIEKAITKSDDFLLFLNGRKPVYEICDIRSILDNSVYFMKKANILNDKLKCEVTYHGTLSQIKVDMCLMNQLFYDLIINTVNTMENGGAVNIDVKNTKSNDLHFVEIAVKGVGREILEDGFAETFEPEYTNKSRLIMGMGLEGCKKIMERHDGLIKVESEVGMGTTIYVYFKAETNLN